MENAKGTSRLQGVLADQLSHLRTDMRWAIHNVDATFSHDALLRLRHHLRTLLKACNESDNWLRAVLFNPTGGVHFEVPPDFAYHHNAFRLIVRHQ